MNIIGSAAAVALTLLAPSTFAHANMACPAGTSGHYKVVQDYYLGSSCNHDSQFIQELERNVLDRAAYTCSYGARKCIRVGNPHPESRTVNSTGGGYTWMCTIWVDVTWCE